MRLTTSSFALLGYLDVHFCGDANPQTLCFYAFVVIPVTLLNTLLDDECP